MPSFAGPSWTGASGLVGSGLGFGVPGTSALLLGVEPELAARGLASAVPDLSLGLGLALAVTGLVLVLEALRLVSTALALRLAARGLRLAALSWEREVTILRVVATSIATDLNAMLGVRNCTPCFIK
jgi:hypothetical protein